MGRKSDTLALIMQDYFTNLVISGDPNGNGGYLTEGPSYDVEKLRSLDFNLSSIGVGV